MVALTTEDKNNIPVKKSPRKKAVKKSVKKSEAVTREKIILVKKTPQLHNHFSSIGKSVSLASVIMTALVVTIVPSNAWILGPIIGAMAIFGIAMGYFASK